MKKILAIVIMLFTVASSHAQYYIFVHQKDGNTVKFPIDNIDSLSIAIPQDIQNLSLDFVNTSGTYGGAVYIGKPYSLIAASKPENANASYVWSVSNPRILSLEAQNNSATFQFSDLGTADIILKDENSGLTASYTATSCVTDFAFTENTGVESWGVPCIEIEVGETYQLHYTYSPSYATNVFGKLSSFLFREYNSSTNSYVVVDQSSTFTVDSVGLLTGIKVGETFIKCHNGGNVFKSGYDNDEVLVSVVEPQPYTVSLNYTNASVAVGETLNLVATISKNYRTYDYNATWSSSNNTVASVSEDGKVTAIGTGVCEIKATYGSTTTACVVTVLPSPSQTEATYGNVTVHKATADSIDITSFEIKAQIDGLNTLEAGSYAVYFYYSDVFQEPNASSGERIKAEINNEGLYTCSLNDMVMCSTYYFRIAAVTFEGNMYYGPSNSFTVKDIVTKGDKIDMGIPGVFFASCDLGANSPEQKGNRYAWGETNTKTDYSDSNYEYYNPNVAIWRNIGNDISGTQYDAATSVLGEGWHMPNKDIVHRLMQLCETKIIRYKDTYGKLFISKNGNVLYVLNNSYWTSTYGTNDDCFATVWTNGGYYGDDYRWAGYYIRPVYGQINYPIEYVDLGLSVNWATCNIGAIQPENTGDYFAWGETSTRSRYAGYGHGSYKYSKYENGAYHYTKYCVDSSYGYEGFTDGKTILESSDDAASILWGSEWRIPTVDEIHELRKNCTWTWTNQGGMNGYLVTSNISGYENSSIFLPAAGSRGTSEKTYMEGESGFYWSSTLNTSDNAYMLHFRTGGVDDYISHARYEGLTIRPVSQSNSWGGITKITLKYDSVYVLTNQEYNLRIDSLMSGDYDYSFLKVKWTSSNPDVATIDANGTITGLSQGKTIITATCLNGSTTCVVTVADKVCIAIDLGLSVKWASCNIGASMPERNGEYYGWGEVENKTNYTWSFYSYYSNSTMSKYNSTDNKTTLDLEDDVAHAKWGGNWRMPTNDELIELYNNCDWKWTNLYGVGGYIVTSKKEGYEKASIFLPSGGYYSGSYCTNSSAGYYWSSTLADNNEQSACCLNFNVNSHWSYSQNRYFGAQIRPVCP